MNWSKYENQSSLMSRHFMLWLYNGTFYLTDDGAENSQSAVHSGSVGFDNIKRVCFLLLWKSAWQLDQLKSSPYRKAIYEAVNSSKGKGNSLFTSQIYQTIIIFKLAVSLRRSEAFKNGVVFVCLSDFCRHLSTKYFSGDFLSFLVFIKRLHTTLLS